MKNIFAILGCALMLIYCSKKDPQIDNTAQTIAPKYDTTAIDSFSAGATSIDVVQKIKMSSIKYQDSLKQVLEQEKEEAKIKVELDKENKKKAEEDKKSKDAESSKNQEQKAE